MNQRLQQLFQFLIQEPNDPFLLYAIATEYKAMNELHKALDTFLTLLQNQPDYLPTYYHLAKTYEQLGKDEEAIAIYQKGIALALQQKDHHTARELQEALQQLTF